MIGGVISDVAMASAHGRPWFRQVLFIIRVRVCAARTRRNAHGNSATYRMYRERGAPRRTIETLWTVYKDQHVMTCLIVEAPVGEELRVLVDGEMYLTEVHSVRDGLVGRADTLHRALLAHGW